LSLCLSLMVASFSLNLCMFPLSTSEKLRGGSALVWHIKQARCLLRDIKYYPFFFFFTILVNILIGIQSSTLLPRVSADNQRQQKRTIR
jgi:hypothetical protein